MSHDVLPCFHSIRWLIESKLIRKGNTRTCTCQRINHLWKYLEFLSFGQITTRNRGGAYVLYRSQPPGGKQYIWTSILGSAHFIHLYIQHMEKVLNKALIPIFSTEFAQLYIVGDLELEKTESLILVKDAIQSWSIPPVFPKRWAHVFSSVFHRLLAPPLQFPDSNLMFSLICLYLCSRVLLTWNMPPFYPHTKSGFSFWL